MNNTINNAIMDLLEKTERLTPAQIFKKLPNKSRHSVMQAINQLVRDEQLIYSYELGTAFVRLSTNKAVTISNRIVLMPPERSLPEHLASKIVIKLLPGAAFGDGHHPTTILALKLLDAFFLHQQGFVVENALDIGTGTGVLAIAASKLGANNVIATDRESVAVYEAKNNVSINQLENCITVIKSNGLPDGCFQLIIANLRFPSLLRLSGKLYDQLDAPGFVVCSGFKDSESKSLIKQFEYHNFILLDCERSNQWSGALFLKNHN